MTPEQSLFLVKKKWDENVYCGMRMESRNITFPQTRHMDQFSTLLQDYCDTGEGEALTDFLYENTIHGIA